MGRIILAAALPLAMLATAPAAMAQAGSVPVAGSGKVDAVFYAVYDNVIGGADMEKIAVAGADSIFDGLGRTDPNFIRFSQSKPGLKAQFRAAALPFLRVWMQRSTASVRDDVALRLSKYFTIDEAREVAAFYGSPLGHKIMGSVSSNMSFDATVDEALKDPAKKPEGGFNEKDMDRTVGNAMPGMMGSMTAADRAELVRLQSRPAFRKLAGMGALLKEVPQPDMDKFSTPAEREGFQKAIVAVFEKAAKGG